MVIGVDCKPLISVTVHIEANLPKKICIFLLPRHVRIRCKELFNFFLELKPWNLKAHEQKLLSCLVRLSSSDFNSFAIFLLLSELIMYLVCILNFMEQFF